MKKRRIILAVISILVIALFSTVSLAITTTKMGMTFDEAVEAARNRNDKLKNEVVKETVEEKTEEEPIENKVTVQDKEENENKDEVVKEDDKIKDKKDDVIEDDETTDKKEDSKESEKNNENDVKDKKEFEDKIEEDLSIVDEVVEYKTTEIDGNVHIFAEKVILEDVKISGNLFIVAVNAELNNVIVEGTVYAILDNIIMDGQITSAYIMGENVVLKESASIIKELRVGATNFEFNGFVGRDVYVCSEEAKILDKAEIYGDCMVEAAIVDISEDVKIEGEKSIKIIEKVNPVIITNQMVYSKIITNCVIVLIVAIFVLYSSPKFVAVNGKLRLRDFIKSLFTGIIELVLVFGLFAGTIYLGYGIGFAFALLILSLILVYLGKMLFIISAGIRLAGKTENVSRIKSFFIILIVLVIVESSSLLMLLGNMGILATLIINLVLGIVGFGSLVRVVLTPSRRKKQQVKNKTVTSNTSGNNIIREVRPDDFVMKGVPMETKIKEVEERTTVTEKTIVAENIIETPKTEVVEECHVEAPNEEKVEELENKEPSEIENKENEEKK